ncbi:MAG: PhnD/SsuA/transferrin family substrate-binding protein [Gemmatimonas sp.]|nr:PhnD/SsuA/transferrin family substrate-binding protein [Gemmatimonas sp.]
MEPEQAHEERSVRVRINKDVTDGPRKRHGIARMAQMLGLVILGLALPAGLVACGSDGDEQSEASGSGTQKLRVVYNINAAWLPAMIAQDEGFFADNGLDVELSVYESASTVPVTLGEDKQYDLGGANPASLMAAQSQGIDVVAVAGATLDSVKSPLVSLIADPNITSLADLSGKRIGLPALEGTYYASMVRVLDDAGVPPGSYDTIQIPTPRAAEQLRAGVVDAVMTVPPFVEPLIREGYGHLSDPQTEATSSDAVTSAFWMATRDWADANEDAITAWVRSYKDAINFIKDEPAKSRTILQKYTDLPADVVAETKFPAYEATVTNEKIAAWMPVFEAADQLPSGLDESQFALPLQVQLGKSETSSASTGSD